MPDGTATGPIGQPIDAEGLPGVGGALIGAPVTDSLAQVGGPGHALISQPISEIFNIGGAPIAVLGGVFSGGLPIGGPVTQIFRGGSAPTPPTLFINTITPSGPIGQFFIGSGGGPIGEDVFGGGGLPIGTVPAEVEAVQARTALVGPAALAFGGETSSQGGL